jgi:putative transposase
MTAYTTGTSTRKVDDLVRALGYESGVSKSTVSRICAGIDEEVAVFRTCRLDHVAFPYVYLDATYIKARINHRIISRAAGVTTGVTAHGDREVLGIDGGGASNERRVVQSGSRAPYSERTALRTLATLDQAASVR